MLKALILSGGTGSRLRPLTYTNAKQLLPLANKPILIHVIEKIVKVGIKEIGIIVGDTHEEIKKEIGNGEKWKVKITYIHQASPLGLAHAVNMARGFIGEDDFLMILGDNVFSMELDTFVDAFYQSRSLNPDQPLTKGNQAANASLLLYKVKNPSQFGVAVVKDKNIIKLVEKPKEFVSDLIITGIYLFDKQIFTAIDKIEPSPRGELEITDAIQKLLDMGGRVTYEKIKGWWKDTGNKEDMLEANRLMLSEIKSTSKKSIKQENAKLEGKLLAEEGVEIINSTITGPVSIGEGTVICNSHIGPNTSIGQGVVIEGCQVENSIIMDETQMINIPKKISASLIGKGSKIKAATEAQELSFLIGDGCEMEV